MVIKGPPERIVVRNILSYLHSRGAFAEKTHGTGAQRLGMPDILFIYKGRGGGLEVKRDEHTALYETTAVQRRVLYEIDAASGVAAVVWTVEQVRLMLDLIDREEGLTSD